MSLSSESPVIDESRRSKGDEAPPKFFQICFLLMVSDTETSIVEIFCIAFKSTISCTGIRTKILNAKLILLNLGSPNVHISL